MTKKRDVKRKVSPTKKVRTKEVRARAEPLASDPEIIVSKDRTFSTVYVTNATVSLSEEVVRITCWDEYPSHMTLPGEEPNIEKVAKVQIVVPINQLEILLEEIFQMRDVIQAREER